MAVSADRSPVSQEQRVRRTAVLALALLTLAGCGQATRGEGPTAPPRTPAGAASPDPAAAQRYTVVQTGPGDPAWCGPIASAAVYEGGAQFPGPASPDERADAAYLAGLAGLPDPLRQFLVDASDPAAFDITLDGVGFLYEEN